MGSVLDLRERISGTKVDIRAVMFRGADEILLVSDKIDGGNWNLPGNWTDVGQAPFGVAAKGAREETRLLAEPRRLLEVFDKREDPHPAQLSYVYKAEIKAGELIRTQRKRRCGPAIYPIVISPPIPKRYRP